MGYKQFGHSVAYGRYLVLAYSKQTTNNVHSTKEGVFSSSNSMSTLPLPSVLRGQAIQRRFVIVARDQSSGYDGHVLRSQQL
jgi:hypothetical protein